MNATDFHQVVLNASNTSFKDNSTLSTEGVTKWSLVPVFYLVTSVIGFIGNGVILLVFKSDRTLRQKYPAFNVYVVNLLFANLCCILFIYPMSIISNVHLVRWSMSEQACSLYLYSNDIFEGVVLNNHAIIAGIRVWAIVHPISYRHFHTVRVALVTCIGLWIYIHLLILPRLVMDAAYYRRPVATLGCMINMNVPVQRALSLAEYFIGYLAPSVVILLAFPTILFAKLNGDLHLESTRIERQSTQIVVEAKRKGRYIMLATLTVSVTVCWTPSLVYYALVYFRENFWVSTFYQVAIVLFTCQTMLDPVLFILTFNRIWEALKRLCTPSTGRR
ncbi:hypothetical protein BV898_06124 [Hypsibius exemplaris]|uniref:G-protein coupled receptors family 1 profile domain-containing protein n=1 Tax=Hypsibius exemplaris TaxID=2072580 RepID=A0A1W0WXC0_HYPEX|nr:hypothetical protein BV898_06124 [Hypsibius exemplaris]